MRYLEFAVASNFSFLRGASHPEELMVQAAHAGLAGIGLCDRNTVAGVVRAHVAKREHKLALKYHPGARLVFADGTPDILAYPRDRAGWGRLTRLLTVGNLRGKKGECVLTLDDLIAHSFGLELVVLPSPRLRGEGGERRRREPDEGAFRQARTRDDAPSPTRHRYAQASDLSPHAGRGENARGTSEIHITLSTLRAAAPGRVRLAATMLYRGRDRERLARLKETARDAQVPLIATNDVHMHHPDRRRLADVLTCIREKTTIDRAGRKLAVNAERFLKPPEEMVRLFKDAPEAIEETAILSDALSFSLDDLKYEYPDETIAGFATPQDALAHLAYEGAKRRYPEGIPDNVRQNIEHELALVAERQYAAYFLTVHDIVQYARSRNILCQGRGSAANSTICYCLEITAVNPAKHDLLFERFISTERDEPPDIDVDFEHERREEVIQYIYEKYGRERAGIAATVISYRGRSAIRDVGKVFGLSEDTIGALSSSIWGGGGSGAVSRDAVKRTGLDPASPRMRQVLALAAEINGFPRHLSQHVGGFVITRSRLDEVVPIGNAAMEERTFVEWDKDDLDAVGILKIDVLGLGMLSCLRKALDLVIRHYPEALSQAPCPPLVPSPTRAALARARAQALVGEGSSELQHRRLGEGAAPPPHPTELVARPALPSPTRGEGTTIAADLSTIPPDDPAVYRMLSRADSLGVFQVESRAQMSMLPRLRPKDFYDLVIEVAIVRPGPIQGDMVHPYLRRREGREQPEYPKPAHGQANELEPILKKTLGVPLFQEQAMKIAIVAGGFTPGEADKLRRAMATFKRTGTIGAFRDKMVNGMLAKGYPRDFAERCFGQIEGFGEYGFPESHAASFALLVYASAWLKCHYPDVFAAALLNAQPMGFYSSAQIVRDVREHGVAVLPPDVNHSNWDATLEVGPHAAEHLHELHRDMREDVHTRHAIRLGLREIKGLSEEDGKLIVARRASPLPPLSAFSPPPERGRSPAEAESESGRVGVTHKSADQDDPHSNPPPFRGREQAVPAEASYVSVRDLWLRTGLPPRVLERLADADAFGSLGLSRRKALWAAKALGRVGDSDDDLPLFKTSATTQPRTLFTSPRLRGEVGEQQSCEPGEGASMQAQTRGNAPSPAPPSLTLRRVDFSPQAGESAREPDVHLPPMPVGEEVLNDYRFLRLSLRAHPAQFLRDDLRAHGILPNEVLRSVKPDTYVSISGLVTCRQQPGSAKGVIFLTIEDESAVANVIIWPQVLKRVRPIVLGARYVAVHGRVQKEAEVIHVVAETLEDFTPLLARLTGHDFDAGPATRVARENRRTILPREMPQFAADLDVHAHGSAHVPTRRAG